MLLQQTSCSHRWSHHGAIGHEQQIIPLSQQFTATDLEGFPAIFQTRNTFARAPRNAHGNGTVVAQTGHQHALQLGFVFGRHHREVGDTAQVRDVVLTLVGGAISAHDAGTVQHKGDRQLLNPHVVDQLVVGPLQEGAVDRHHRLQAIGSHACGQGDGMLLSNAHIDVLIGNGLLQQIQAGAGSHRRSDSNDA